MRHLVDLIPLPRALAELILIVGLFLCAIVVSRIAGLLAAWLVSLRSVHGEVIRVQNHQVLATRLIPRARRDLEIELFVSDLEAGERLVERLGRIVPVGPTHFIRTPQVVESEKLDDELYRITASAAVAPGREWLAEDLLPKLARERTDGLLVHGPVVTPNAEQAASRFARAVWLGRGQREPTEPLARLRAVERRLRKRG